MPIYKEKAVNNKWHAQKSRRQYDYLNRGGASILGWIVNVKRSVVMSSIFPRFILHDVMVGYKDYSKN